MVKKLWLLRHGQAEHQTGKRDFERSLTERGRSAISLLGKEMAGRDFFPQLVLCSPSSRTRQTADLFLKELHSHGKMKYVDAIYEASLAALLEVVNSADSPDNLLLIGHNPGISYLLDYLADRSFSNLNPGQLVEITFTGLEWSEVSKGTGILKS